MPSALRTRSSPFLRFCRCWHNNEFIDARPPTQRTELLHWRRVRVPDRVVALPLIGEADQRFLREAAYRLTQTQLLQNTEPRFTSSECCKQNK